MGSVDGLCIACKRPVADHLPSRADPPAEGEVPPGKVAVVNGRCWPDGQRCAEKLCRVHLREPMTVQEYRRRFEAGEIALEPCPCCGGLLESWGSSPRTVLEGEPRAVGDLRLLRGRCRRAGCPLCTVTHYPCLLTPYHAEPTADREAAVRAHVEDGLSWSTVGQQRPWVSLATVQRWQRQIAVRAQAVMIGLLGVWQRLDAAAPTAAGGSDGSRRAVLQAMFRLCDAVQKLLGQREGWTDLTLVPALTVPRLFQPPMPTTLPVWT